MYTEKIQSRKIIRTMMRNKIKEKLKSNPRLKSFLLYLIIHPIKTRPRRYIRCLRFIYMERGNKSYIYRNTRKDIVPFNPFKLGEKSIIESFSTVNNMVGAITIGSHSRIGLNNTIIGPVCIGNHVNIAQNVVISGLNHNYLDPDKTIISQGITTSEIIIENDVWIGANTTILAGSRIGRHSVIAAGSTVINNVPAYSVVAGNPGKIIKRYDFTRQEWVKI